MKNFLTWPTGAEVLFSFKTFAASLLALYLSYRIGLPRPFWAMTTAYIVSQPFSGAARSKAAYRLGGTILGSAATVLLVPRLANSPELLSLALALWVGGCLYISLLDRTPRSYVFMLAGYTAALIGFPTVTDPITVFDVALARVQEITLGIVCSTVVHSLVFPQGLGPVLLERLDHAIGDARRWFGDAMTGIRQEQIRGDQRRLAGDITELRIMSTHLPFDTSHLRWTVNAVSALQDRLAAMVPLLSAVDDRLHALLRINAAAISEQWRKLLHDIAVWGQGAEPRTPEHSLQLRQSIAAMVPVIDRASTWEDILKLNLATRLQLLMDASEECRSLRSAIDDVLHDRAISQIHRLPRLSTHVLHRDIRLALMSSAAAVIAILACCAFWIITAWPAGSAAAMMAAVFCCFFATQDDPVPGIRTFLNYTVYSIPLSALYLLVLMPAAHNFETLALALAPVFLLLGVYIARPSTAGRAMALLFGVTGTLSLQDTGTADIVSFINGILAQIAGLAAAALITRLFRSVSAEWTARRLQKATWHELVRLTTVGNPPSPAEVSARMLDRIGLLAQRLSTIGPQQDANAANTIAALQVGLNITVLRRLGPMLDSKKISLEPLMQGLAEYFSHPPASSTGIDMSLLNCLDDTLRAACAFPSSGEQREVVAALAGIRRGLFPNADPYQPPVNHHGEAQ